LGDLLEEFQRFRGEEDEPARAHAFARNMAIWTEGRYGRLLNRQSNISIQNRFLVFELGKLDNYPDLQSLIFFIIRSAIAERLYQPNLRKVIVIDEGWRFFNDEVGSRLIDDLYRTARKFNGLVLSISQNPEDFLNARAAGSIVSNSFTKYVLKLNKSHELLKNFGLNEAEISQVRTLLSKPGDFSEIFIKYNASGAVARLEPTSLQYWIATTDPDDLALEEKERAARPGLDTLKLLQYLAKTHPKGAKQAPSQPPAAKEAP